MAGLGLLPGAHRAGLRPHRAELRPPELEILSRNSGKLAEKRPVHHGGRSGKGRAAPKAGNRAGTGGPVALHPLIPRENRYIRTELGKFCPFFVLPRKPLYKKECPGLSYTDLLNVTTV